MSVETDRQIDNDRARVTRYRLAPGASIGFHRHAHDYVVVPITSGRLRILEKGKESISELSAGVTYFRAAGVEHDVANGGSDEMIFIEVEILG
jgi:quercetin dioxygenase-like cupin family protein